MTVNTPVVVASIPSDMTATLNQYFNFAINASNYFFDPDINDTLTLTVSVSPTADCYWLSFTTINNTLWGMVSDVALIDKVCTITI